MGFKGLLRWLHVMAPEKRVRVFSGLIERSFFEGYNWRTGMFNKLGMERVWYEELYVTVRGYCGYSRKWAVDLSKRFGSSPVVFSGVVGEDELKYFHKGLIWIIPAGEIRVDKLYRIKSANSDYHNVFPADNSFVGDEDLSRLLTTDNI